MTWIYRILGAIYALFIALSIAVIVGLFYLLPARCYRPLRRGWARFVLAICCVRVQLDGRFDSSAQLLVINHASILDIIALEALHDGDLCWFAKKEIAALPVFGQIINKPQMISVDRENAREFVRSLAVAKERVAQGRVLAIFPEGTRGDGRRLLRFKKGSQMLMERLNLRAQPVVIAGSRRAMDSVRGVLVRPFSRVVIRPLECAQIAEPASLREVMQAQLDEINEKFFGAAGAAGTAGAGAGRPSESAAAAKAPEAAKSQEDGQ